MQNHRLFIETILKQCGKTILEKFDTDLIVSSKEDPSQLVTEVDIISEKQILTAIKKEYPSDSIIAEESGFTKGISEYTWVIDPIDGTSNFSYGIPWFGTMIAVLKAWEPIAAGIYLPTTNELYSAGLRNGAYKNGKLFHVRTHEALEKTVLSFCLSAAASEKEHAYELSLLQRLLPYILNVRSTNSAVDYVYAAEGKLSGIVNLTNKIWDIAPIILIGKEAGCVVTAINGREHNLQVTQVKEALFKNYDLLMAEPSIHKLLLNFLHTS